MYVSESIVVSREISVFFCYNKFFVAAADAVRQRVRKKIQESYTFFSSHFEERVSQKSPAVKHAHTYYL